MDSPVRQYQKQKDYRRHKLFRKIRRRQAAERQQAINEPIRQLKRKLKRYDSGKDVNANNVFDFVEDGEDFRKQYQKVYGKDGGQRFYEYVNSHFGNDLTYLAGTLPEVTATPTFNTDIARLKLKQMIPDRKLRQTIISGYNPMKQGYNGEYIDTAPAKQYDEYETINRLYNIWNASKRPSVHREGDIMDPILQKFIGRGGYRDHYFPLLNNIYLGSKHPLLEDELSHAYQYNAKGLNFKPDVFNIPGDIHVNGKSGYDRPGHVEYEAHRIIQPVLSAYVDGYLNSLDEVNNIINEIQSNPGKYSYSKIRQKVRPNNTTIDNLYETIPSQGIQSSRKFYREDSYRPFNSGKDSGIHIKPQNRGKFTALKKRTGKSASWFKAHGTPAQKKMATFALNARKWEHK